MQNDKLDDQTVAADLVRSLIQEKRSERRWKNIRFFIGFAVVIVLGLIVFSQMGAPVTTGDTDHGYVALVRLDGNIGPGEDFSAVNVLPLLQAAFSDKDAKGVVLEINSGGGTPVQASIIHDTVLDLKKKYHKKVVVVGEDLMASGAYFVAVSADKIYVNPNTITGSIGVIMKEFGFPELLKKIGVDRRVYASGANKDRLDPFLPQNQEDIAKIRQVIGEVHSNFQEVVKQGRQGKLHTDDPSELFSGDFWSGETALKLGLVDDLGNLSDAMQKEFHVTGYKDYSQQQSLLKSVVGQLGSSLNLALGANQVHVLEKLG